MDGEDLMRLDFALGCTAPCVYIVYFVALCPSKLPLGRAKTYVATRVHFEICSKGNLKSITLPLTVLLWETV